MRPVDSASAGHQECRLCTPIRGDVRHQSRANLRETVAKLSKKEAPSAQAPLIDSLKPPQLPQIGRQPSTSDLPQCTGIGLYREYAIAIQDEVGDSNGGKV